MNRKQSNLLALFIFSVFFLIISTTLFSEDFTFNVPVELNNLNLDINKGQVMCVVQKDNSVGVGGGMSEFNIINGSFNGIITVKFNAVPGKDPANASIWSCGLFLKSKGNANYKRPSILLSSNPEYQYDSSKPFLEGDNGKIPTSTPQHRINPK